MERVSDLARAPEKVPALLAWVSTTVRPGMCLPYPNVARIAKLHTSDFHHRHVTVRFLTTTWL